MYNVLLVEDDPNLGEVTAEGLKLAGHRVAWVTTVAAGLDALTTEHSFHVVLLDLRLGEDSGETIFEKLRLLEITYPPVIVLSAEPISVLRLAAQFVTTEHILSKPASIRQIDEAIQRAVAGS